MNNLTPYRPEIRFADIDAMGHVNNAVYFTYFEQARMHFFSQLVDEHWDWNEHGILVARNEVDYKMPIFLHDKVEIVVYCKHIGSKSITLAYEVKKQTSSGEVVCSVGASVVVCFNHKSNKTAEVPAQWREAFAKLPAHQSL
jgi:acyl-CoA thioester hydrolase